METNNFLYLNTPNIPKNTIIPYMNTNVKAINGCPVGTKSYSSFKYCKNPIDANAFNI
jgi:hypothetical protein